MSAHLKEQPLLIGAHTSIAGGVHHALLEGKQIGATTVQIFTANQRRWDTKDLSAEAVEQWHLALQETGLKKIMSHDSYLINLGAPDPENLKKSRHAFHQEILRCQQLNISFLNFHPGAAIKDDPQACMDRICESLLQYENLLSKSSLRLLFEITAGQGSAIGSRFEEIAYLLEKVEKRLKVGVCVDTCHAFVAGYDLRTASACDVTLKQFDKIIGLKHLYAFHVNDSKTGFNSHVDRHALLGKGEIGIECFKFLMNDPRTRDIPKYLETPGELSEWTEEISLLRSFAKIEI